VARYQTFATQAANYDDHLQSLHSYKLACSLGPHEFLKTSELTASAPAPASLAMFAAIRPARVDLCALLNIWATRLKNPHIVVAPRPNYSRDWRASRVAHLGMQVMCQSCVDINKRVERHRELLRSTTDPAEIERIKRLIARLYADRVRLHQNPEN
jgi:hypothetical protein